MTTDTLLRNLEEIQARALRELKASPSSEAVEQWRVAYLGRRGELTLVLRGLGPLAPEDRRTVGGAANKVKALLEESLAEAEEAPARQPPCLRPPPRPQGPRPRSGHRRGIHGRVSGGAGKLLPTGYS